MVYKENNPGIQTVELDTVEGVKGGAVLLTIHFVAACLQIAFRRETNDAKSVTDIFKNLYDRLGEEKYLKGNMENEFRIRKEIVDVGSDVASENERGTEAPGP